METLIQWPLVHILLEGAKVAPVCSLLKQLYKACLLAVICWPPIILCIIMEQSIQYDA